MANVVRIKRRLTGDAGAPSALKNAELAFNEVGNVLYYGKGDDNGNATSRIAIGGDGAFLDLSTAQTVAGVKSFSDSPLIPTADSGDNSTKAATTAFVTAAVAAAITTAVLYKGTVDASAADPATAGVLDTPVNGHMYRVTTSGNLAFGAQLNTGDYVIYDGTAWNKIDSTDPSVNGTTDRIAVTPTGDTSYAVDIAASYVGQSSITTLGTITAGVWNGTIVSSSYGGTGADLSSAPADTMFKMGASGAFVPAIKGVDFLAADDVVDGGVF